MCVLSRFSHVWLCSPIDCSPPGSSVHGIVQAGILEWMPSSRGSSRPRDWTCVSCTAGIFFTAEPPRKPNYSIRVCLKIQSLCQRLLADHQSYFLAFRPWSGCFLASYTASGNGLYMFQVRTIKNILGITPHILYRCRSWTLAGNMKMVMLWQPESLNKILGTESSTSRNSDVDPRALVRWAGNKFSLLQQCNLNIRFLYQLGLQ